MKYADIKYVGPMQSQITRRPSGEKYTLKNPMGGSPTPTPCSSLQDALSFDSNDAYEVEWTAKGEVAKKASGPISDVSEILSEFGYHQKKKLAKAFGVPTEDSHPTEDELDEELEPVVQDLKQQMEN